MALPTLAPVEREVIAEYLESGRQELARRLQALADGLGTNWQDGDGSTLTNQVNATIDAGNGAVFYRMIYA